MTDYSKLYSKMFNAITDIIESLKQLQLDVEEAYINDGFNREDIIRLHKKEKS